MKEIEIIDMHAHIFPDKVAEKAVQSIGQYYGLDMWCSGTVAGLFESGKKIGVKRYLVHSTATKVEQVMAINDYISVTIKKYPELIGFGTLHKCLENINEEVDRIIKNGLCGVKLHPEFQEFYIDDEDMMPLYAALEGRMPILIHMGDENKTSSSPERLSKVLMRFPKLTVIAAHLGGYMMWEEATEYLVGKNLYFDTSSTLCRLAPDKATDIIRKHGVDKVVFGSDYPMWDHESELLRFNKMDLTEIEQRKILYDNANRLLKSMHYRQDYIQD